MSSRRVGSPYIKSPRHSAAHPRRASLLLPGPSAQRRNHVDNSTAHRTAQPAARGPARFKYSALPLTSLRRAEVQPASSASGVGSATSSRLAAGLPPAPLLAAAPGRFLFRPRCARAYLCVPATHPPSLSPAPPPPGLELPARPALWRSGPGLGILGPPAARRYDTCPLSPGLSGKAARVPRAQPARRPARGTSISTSGSGVNSDTIYSHTLSGDGLPCLTSISIKPAGPL